MELPAAADTRFPTDYGDARSRFRRAAETAGGQLRSYRNPTSGPLGEALACDCAWFGPEDAAKVLVIMSGTHGVEGFCGSGIQLDWLEEGNAAALPADHAALAIHAINPCGFAWIRRVTEENVDLNRNFVDHGQALPRNDDYDALHDAICPGEWNAASRAATQARLEAFAASRGTAALQKAMSGGQYSHSDGIFYGGMEPVWARRTLTRILADFAGGARRVALIDFHTGLGPYGHGERIMTHPPESPASCRAEHWYGDVTNPALGTSASAEPHGDKRTARAAALK